MTISMNDIQWQEGDAAIIAALTGEHRLLPLKPGLEAEVVIVETNTGKFVLKLWNKESRPDISRQYKLLNLLDRQGINVSKPYGWGVDGQGNQALLTEFGGNPPAKLDKVKIKNLAKLLTDIHTFNTEEIEPDLIPAYDFASYFFPSLNEHEDLAQIFRQALDVAQMTSNALIHGDFNLGNVLEQGDRLMVIDWTNGQMGDARYDMVWAHFLITVFAGERIGNSFGKALQELVPLKPETYSAFQALACLRWLLLSRISDLPKGEGIEKRIRSIVLSNEWLSEDIIR
ncbi:aminoglycoside phosphotransferase family protein [Paenibacillus sp. CAU 1782]